MSPHHPTERRGAGEKNKACVHGVTREPRGGTGSVLVPAKDSQSSTRSGVSHGKNEHHLQEASGSMVFPLGYT